MLETQPMTREEKKKNRCHKAHPFKCKELTRNLIVLTFETIITNLKLEAEEF